MWITEKELKREIKSKGDEFRCKNNKNFINPRATDVTFLPKNSQHWWMLLRFAHSLACWCLSLGVVAQSLKPVKLFSQQLPTVLLLRDRLRVAQQCWIRLHCSSHIVGARHVRAWFYGLYPSHAIAQKLSVSNGNGFSNRNLKPNAKTRT